MSAPPPAGPGGAGALRPRPADPPGPAAAQAAGRTRWPLYAAGFTTAFGAHAVAASLGVYTGTRHGSLLTLGILPALYGGAEVVLKPVFGALADRVGGKPVLIGGLLVFAAASGGFLLAGSPAALFAARLGQGAGAAAFSPAASMLVARLAPGGQGRASGSYGAWKGLGYALGPLLGSALVALHGYGLLFAALAALGLAVAGWAVLAVPAAPPLPRHRQTIADLTRRLPAPAFPGPTAALAGATAALSAGVGFLPVLGHDAGLGALATGAAVSLLAATAAVIQPWAGHACDTGRLGARAGLGAGLAASAAGLGLAAFVPGLPGLLSAAVTIGLGTALITPLGVATLAATAPEGQLGQTMGAAEVGREPGDAGGPLLVGVIAAATLTGGLAALAALLTLGTGITAGARRYRPKNPSVP